MIVGHTVERVLELGRGEGAVVELQKQCNLEVFEVQN